MADQPYTPTEARVCIDYCNATVARRKADPSIGMAEADAEFDRFIEAVKRDAAQEALDGLAEAWETDAQEAAEDGRLSVAARIRSNIAGVIGYRYSRFPEETP